jgi:sugar phosphate isomerase/epimerase
MSNLHDIIIAAKCAPEEDTLTNIEKAGLTSVELYTNLNYLYKTNRVKQICKKFPFRYAIHAPNNCYEPDLLAELVADIKAEVVVFHDIYWYDEWEYIVKTFKTINTKLCVENISSIHEPLKLMRRFGLKRCLDLEHLQMQCAGVFEEGFLPVIRQASHIHLSGYYYSSNLWHTHIHHSPEHNIYLLNLLRKEGYSGFVVSEARVSYQILSEFKKLNKFFQKWKGNNS